MRRLLLFLVIVLATADVPASVELEECRISPGPGFPGIKARCADVERPLDPDRPDAETITLRVAVVPALNLDPEPDPVVPLAGGPGQGAIEMYTLYAGAFEPIRRDRDILLVDQRGTGASTRLSCDIDADITAGAGSAEEALELTRQCLDELPHDPRWFTTSVAVRDLDAIREALGYPALNLYGVSYGTRVAQHYARRYPGTTRTIVLDGVVPPDLPLGPDIALEAQNAVDSIFARCAEDAACNAAFPDIGASFDALRQRLADDALEIRMADPLSGRVDTVTFGADELAVAIRLLAYAPNTIALIPLLVHEAANGNPEPLAAQYLTTATNLSDALAIGMHNAVMCAEDAPRYASMTIDRAALEASYLGPMLVDMMLDVCEFWPKGPVDPGFDEPLDTDIPTLLLSGSADPITPPGYAVRAAASLETAWLLTGRDQGHGQLAVGCTSEVIAGFIETTAILDGDASCIEDSFVPPFFIDFSGPAP
jgi:pimeloyl-ACP methyl ester carboxylesterase